MLQLNSTDTPGQRNLSDRGPREQIQAVTDTYKYVTADDSYVSWWSSADHGFISGLDGL